APWSRAGPTGGSMGANRPAGPPLVPGCTGLTTTGPTAHSVVVHPSPAAPTSPSPTPSAGLPCSARASPRRRSVLELDQFPAALGPIQPHRHGTTRPPRGMGEL